jgi:hypothetical protein
LAGRSQQTHAKRARELAVKERRERKRAKKAAQRAAGDTPAVDGEGGAAEAEGPAETASTDWIQ